MKKSLITLLLILFVFPSLLPGQSFDWNVRGGLNLMNSFDEGKDISLQYHFGAQAGVRIANYGFYGEALYSMHENQDGGEPVPYLIPAIVVKGYWRKSMFAEFGACILTILDDTDISSNTLNPDNMVSMLAGIGVHFSRMEFSMRAVARQSYGVFQATLAVKF